MKLTNLHLQHTTNIGDQSCAPSLYLNLGAEQRDFRDPVEGGNALIIGGGGLLYEPFTSHIERHLQAARGPLIAWGVGTNTHGVSHAPLPTWLKRCDLVGLRDDTPGHRWVPCASCLSPEMDRTTPAEEEAVVYRHGSVPLNIPDCEDLPMMTNEGSSLADVVTFLLRGRHVITNTYHGIFWATLLRRRVIAYPFSSRHHHLRHRPLLVTDQRPWREFMDATRVYPEALEECRDANHAFFNEVKALLGRA